jgi:hypothetical protein
MKGLRSRHTSCGYQEEISLLLCWTVFAQEKALSSFVASPSSMIYMQEVSEQHPHYLTVFHTHNVIQLDAELEAQVLEFLVGCLHGRKKCE